MQVGDVKRMGVVTGHDDPGISWHWRTVVQLQRRQGVCKSLLFVCRLGLIGCGSALNTGTGLRRLQGALAAGGYGGMRLFAGLTARRVRLGHCDRLLFTTGASVSSLAPSDALCVSHGRETMAEKSSFQKGRG